MNEINRLQQLAGILTEIKVNKPKRIWDLTKYIPNFTGKDMQVGDEILFPPEIGSRQKNTNAINKVKSIENDIQDEKEYFVGENGYYTSDWLRDINNRNKNK